MKQIGLALIQYAQDNDNRTPSGHSGSGLGWAGEVYPYVKSTAVFKCPEDKHRAGNVISYAYNSNVAALFNDRKAVIGDITNPQTTVIGFEVSGSHSDLTVVDEGASKGVARFSAAGNGLDGGLHSVLSGADPVTYATGVVAPGDLTYLRGQFPSAGGRHVGVANYLFVDGHVKALAPKEVSATAASGDSTYRGTFRIK